MDEDLEETLQDLLIGTKRKKRKTNSKKGLKQCKGKGIGRLNTLSFKRKEENLKFERKELYKRPERRDISKAKKWRKEVRVVLGKGRRSKLGGTCGA